MAMADEEVEANHSGVELELCCYDQLLQLQMRNNCTN